MMYFVQTFDLTCQLLFLSWTWWNKLKVHLILKKAFHTIDNGLLAHFLFFNDKRSTIHKWIVSFLIKENDVFSLISVNQSIKGWYSV